MTDLRELVLTKLKTLGVKEGAKYFGISSGTASNWMTGKTSPTIDSVQLVMEELSIDPITSKKEEDNLVTWQGKSVMLLLPVYRTFNADTHFTLFANYAKYGPEKIGLHLVKRTVIHEARNILCNKALSNTEMKQAIMIDDDMILPCGNSALFNGKYEAGVDEKRASVNTISKLIGSGTERGIVSGLYFGRHRKGKAQCSAGFESNNENAKLRQLKVTGYIPMRWVATGAMKIERWVLEEMKKAIDGGKWPECKPNNEQGWYGFFNPIRVGIGEDVSFCLRAGELGIKCYLDADLVLLHNGEKNYGPNSVEE